MPSIDHEMPLEMVRNRPALAPELLRTMFGYTIPEAMQAFLGSETLNDCDPKEYRCDAAVMLGDPQKPDLGIIIEVQSRPSDRKNFTWPAYMANLRARHECDVVLLVFCPDEATARRCAKAIETGHPGWVLMPLVINMAGLPPITDPVRAQQLPELAVLGVTGVTGGPETRPALRALWAALEVLPVDIRWKYHDHVVSRLPALARSILEELVDTKTYKLQSEFALRYEAEGKAEGKAESILQVLSERGLNPSEEERVRIESCRDLDQLETWVKRSITAGTVDEIFK
ncbi:hypothetical protein [Actinomadura sp. 9N407]|uniref:hypothetical protein n=1 Tax=Actinomadura sp. 9N407 TaxID=3375154 RepID=UPI0037A1CCD7